MITESVSSNAAMSRIDVSPSQTISTPISGEMIDRMENLHIENGIGSMAIEG